MAWKKIALVLAERLGHNDACPESHDPPIPDDCPFCADADALRLFAEKVQANGY